MRLIGLRCKHGDMFSLQVLIGRGLFLLILWFMRSAFRFLLTTSLFQTGVYGIEVPPVPIPNTEVKLYCAYDTWTATSRENWSMPVLKIAEYLDTLLHAPLAQLVEQLTLNQWVLGSSPRWCTKLARWSSG